MLQFVQALLQAPGEALLLVGRQRLLAEVPGIEQRRRQRRADLVGQRGDHPPQRRQALVARQLLLETAGIGEVVEQDQLPRFAVQRAGGDGQATSVAQGNLVTVILARSEAAGDHLTPEHAHQRLAKQAQGRRVGLADHAMGIDDDDAAGKQVEQALQAVRQALLFRQLLHALRADQGQLPFQLGNALLQQAIGLAELAGHLVEQREGLLEAGAAGGLGRIGWLLGEGVEGWLHCVSLGRRDVMVLSVDGDIAIPVPKFFSFENQSVAKRPVNHPTGRRRAGSCRTCASSPPAWCDGCAGVRRPARPLRRRRRGPAGSGPARGWPGSP